MPGRKSYEESCKFLESKELLETDKIPPLPDRPPAYDDEELGVSFFRTLLRDVALDSLTLPRTFFGRSEIRKVSFRDTDLSESTANWNDFIDVDFSRADLTKMDLHATVLTRVNFQNAILRNADLRQTSLTGCNFSGADLTGTKLSRSILWFFRLSSAQRAAVNWLPAGEIPEGG